MNTTVKNIILFVVIGALVVLAYIFFIGSKWEEANLSSTSGEFSYDPNIPPVSPTTSEMNRVTQDFLSVLLSVKNIKLDDSIFSDKVFAGLNDSSILLVPTGDEGRPNPFAPISTTNTTPGSTSGGRTGARP